MNVCPPVVRLTCFRLSKLSMTFTTAITENESSTIWTQKSRVLLSQFYNLALVDKHGIRGHGHAHDLAILGAIHHATLGVMAQ